MPRYLIELSHGDEHAACLKALDAIARHGSHFITHSEWGCRDRVHVGWLIVEVDSRQEALAIVPPDQRQAARVVQLNRFTRQEIQAMVERWDGSGSSQKAGRT